MTFDQLGLSADILRAVADAGYTTPTPVQAQAIPVILEGKDVLAGAQTGTGKTAGFTLPLLQLLSTRPAPEGKRPIRALVLTPTRELAAQVQESVQVYGAHLNLDSAVVFGGVSINPQIEALRRGVDILVATPGRLLDHSGQGTVDLSEVEVLVLDEADRMLDMGFIHDIRKVLALLPPQRQNLLFSATFSDEIRELAGRLLDHPVPIQVTPRNTATELVKQRVFRVDRKRKSHLLAYLIGSQDWRQVLVFTRTKHGANRLVQSLEKDGLSAMAIHGNKSQGARTRALTAFKSGELRVLVATDIAARGLDIDELPHVVNFELPHVAEDYVHRIGRTGRAGCEGEAVSLVCVDEDRLLADVERLIGRAIPSEVVEGFEPDPAIQPEPVQKGRGQRQARGSRDEADQATEDQPRREGRGRRRRGKRQLGANGAAEGRSDARSAGNPSQGQARGRKQPGREPNGNQVVTSQATARDEHGDVNGNTLFTDNSNRDAVMLAGGDSIVRRKRGGRGNPRKKGAAEAAAGNKGNGNGQGKGNRAKPGNRGGKRRRNNNGNGGDAPSLLGG